MRRLPGQRRRIVNSIAGHGYSMTTGLKTFHDLGFLVRQNAGDDLVELELLAPRAL